MPAQPVSWLSLITNLPGRNATVRMRLWRAMKAAGAGLLRDGVYVLPASDVARSLFREHAAEIIEGGGTSYVMTLVAEPERQAEEIRSLFDRTEDYAGLHRRLADLERTLAKLSEAEARQRMAALRREVAGVVGRDFFPGAPKEQIEERLMDAEAALNARFSPDEPQPARGRLERLNLEEYQGRTWATRERLWVDRIACAWLIRRFIDPKARFVWLEKIADCPKKALGFDFDGAQFTHVGSKVSFEVLLASFGLEKKPGLVKLGALVHHLDAGGIPMAESAGIASIMAGARARETGDDALLRMMMPVLDSLVAAYGSENA